jgi:protein tyrosine phosphatase (PTP) superfamily phosphohydrolase (DUF442 family)
MTDDRRWLLDLIRPFSEFNMEDPEQRHAAMSIANVRPVWEDEAQPRTAQEQAFLDEVAEIIEHHRKAN